MDKGGEKKMSLDVTESEYDEGWQEVGRDYDEEDNYEDFDTFEFEEVGDEIKGEIAGITEGNYEDSEGYIIEINDSPVEKARLVWASAKQLLGDLQKLDVGDPVKITYEGESETKTGRMMKNFTVETK